jgi:uncharacterized DUF497 family protein
MEFIMNDRIRKKLKDKHGVVPNEVEQCFYNRVGCFLEDSREEHWTYPPTQWFIAETDAGRRLKVVFVENRIARIIYIKTAYEPDTHEEKIYGKYS